MNLGSAKALIGAFACGITHFAEKSVINSESIHLRNSYANIIKVKILKKSGTG